MIRAFGFIHRPDKACRLTNPVTPSLRDEVVGGRFQAINCLATFIPSLRDKNYAPFCWRTSAAARTATAYFSMGFASQQLIGRYTRSLQSATMPTLPIPAFPEW